MENFVSIIKNACTALYHTICIRYNKKGRVIGKEITKRVSLQSPLVIGHTWARFAHYWLLRWKNFNDHIVLLAAAMHYMKYFKEDKACYHHTEG